MKEYTLKKISFFYGFIILVYTFSDGLFGFGFTALMFYKGLNIGTIGLLLGISDLLVTIFEYPTGMLADKYGRKKICGLGFIVYGLGFFAFGLSNTFFLFLISNIIRALGMSLIDGAPSAWYLTELNNKNAYKYKDKMLPFLRGISLLIGSASGIIAGNLSKINMSLPVFIGGFILMVSGIFILFNLEDNKGHQDDNENMIKTVLKNMKQLLDEKSMRIFILFEASKVVMFTIFILSWQIYAVDIIGMESIHLGYLYTVMLISMSLASFLTSYLLKLINGIKITVCGITLTIIGVILFLLTESQSGFVLGFVIFEFGLGLLNSSYQTWLYDYIPNTSFSSYTSALSATSSLIAFVLSIFLGQLILVVGFNFGWITGILFQIVSILLIIRIKKEKRRNV